MAEAEVEVRVARDEGEIGAAQEIRLQVFSRGQGIPVEGEIDGLDPESLHLVAVRRGEVVGTCRLRFPQGHCKLERMAVADGMRGRGIGTALAAGAEREAARRGVDVIVLHSQRAAEGFYAACGYVAEGETFFEEAIPHVLMRKRLRRPGGAPR